MTELCNYRLRIGYFIQYNRNKSKVKPRLLAIKVCRLKLCLIVTITFLNILVLCGDIEVNPGPKTKRKICAVCLLPQSDKEGVSYFSFPLHQNVFL